MSGLVLVAAGGLAREVLAALRASGGPEPVLVDDDPARWGSDVDGARVVGGLEEVKGLPDHQVLLCAGRGRTRRALATRVAELGVSEDRWATVVHPAAQVAPGCEVGAGSVLLAGAVLTAGVRVGRHVVVMPHVTLTHDCVVDDHATLCAGASLGGGAHVGPAAYVGMNAAVREGVRLGAGSTLGMGAVLLRDVPDHETWAGVPAASLPAREARA